MPVECDHADAAGGLGVADGELAAVLLELPADQQRPVVQVHVAPAQGAVLAAAQPDQGDQPEQWVEAVLADVVKELCALVGGPDRDGGVVAGGAPVRHACRGPDHRLGSCGWGQFQVAGRVGLDQAASHRGVARHPQGGADAMKSRRGAGPTVASVGVRARIAKVVCTSSRAQLAQQDPTKVWDEVVVDVLVVAAQRGGPGPKAGRQPVRQPLPGGQQHPACVGGMRSAQPDQGPVGLSAGTVTASPQPAPRSGGSGGQLDREIPTPVSLSGTTGDSGFPTVVECQD